MKTRFELATLLASLLFFLQPAAQSPSATLPGVPAAVREAMLRGDTKATLEALDKAQDPKTADTLLYLRAVALAAANQSVEALATLDQLARSAPKSIWSTKATFLRADLLRDERRFAEAVVIYEAEALRLSGAERQAELAQGYLRFAEELAATPVNPGAKPDFVRAADLFNRVLELAAPDSLRERATYRRAQCIEASENWAGTIQAYQEYLAAFDPTQASKALSGSPQWIFAARLARARAQQKASDPAGARRTLEDLSAELRRAAAGEGKLGSATRKLSAEGLRSVLDLDGEAQYALANTWFAANNQGLGIAALQQFVKRFPSHPRALQARLDLAEQLLSNRRIDEALAVVETILALPKPKPGDAAREATRIAARALFLKGCAFTSAERHEEARAIYADYTAEYPSGVDWSSAQQWLLKSEYRVGELLRDREEFDAAKKSWGEYLARHPLDPDAPQILFDIGELDAAVAQAETTPEAERAGRWRAAIASWRELEAKYAAEDAGLAGRARLRIGATLENELGDFVGAIDAYKSCAGTPAAGEALTALRAMTEPALSVSVEQSVLASEPLRAKLHVRNLEKVTVELWRLDLEAYFRKNLTHAGVEDLDLDLINAQQKFELPVTGYALHKPIEQDFELDVQGPGAWVIAVSSGKLRASALCLRSDLDLIVESSADETLVFVQDMARGEPAAGVRVLAALGERQGSAAPVVLEQRTDARGFVRFALEPRSSAGKVSVLCLREGHVASCGVSFEVAPKQTLLPRALLYTDRPAYRPGESVHWRAIVRGAQDGKFAVQPGRKAEIRIADARGRVVSTQSLAQSEFGTLSGDFALPTWVPLGNWTISLALDETALVNTSFTVAQFQLVHVSLDVSFERTVYYRGEDAVAIVDAHYAHGGPVADSPLSLRLPDGRQSDSRTDAEGHARVVFPTRDLAEEQVLELGVTLNDEPLTANARAWLAFREYTLAASTARETYAIDTPFTVRIGARGPDGAPLAKKLKLAILKIAERPGRPRAEALISEVEVTTNAAGEATPLIKVAKGGNYVLRAFADDRFGNPIEARSEVEILGDDDETTLRLFTDTDVLKVGQAATVTALEREKGGLALLTFEAGRIVDWRWMKLDPGANQIEFPVVDGLAPGFSLALAHMRRGKFRAQQLEFRVERELEVTLKSRAESLVPGSEGTLDIEVRDSQGKPVAAEFSLAIVDAALFDLYPENQPDLRALFQPPALQSSPALDTESSCEFRYEGASWEVSGEVLAEAKREQEELKWKEQREGAAKELAGFARKSDGPMTPGASAVAQTADEFFLGRGLAEQDSKRYGGGGGGGPGYRGAGDSVKDRSAGPEPFALRSPTAYWSAAIATDANGKASAKFTAPITSARWRVSARAAAKDPRAADATAYFTTRAAFFVELRAPQALMEGDKPRCFARVHNTTDKPISAELKLVLRGAGLESTLPAGRIEIPPGAKEVEFPELSQSLQPGSLVLALEASAEIAGLRVEARDGLNLEVAAWGTEFSATQSGALTSTLSFELQLSAARKYTNLALELSVGPNLDAVLVNEALGLRPNLDFRGPTSDSAAGAAELFGAAEVLAQLARSGRDTSTEYARVRERVQQLCAALISAQDPQLGWRSQWNNSADQQGDLCAWAMLALDAARDSGITVAQDCLEVGIAALDRLQRATQSDERKALFQHALARFGRGDYGALNRLHRMRNELSSAALAHTALALVELDRLPMAVEIAAVIESRSVFDPAKPELGGCFSVDKNLPWSRSKVGTAALCVLALEATAAKSPQLESGVQYLIAHRPWSDPRTSGFALAALARHAGLTLPTLERCEVSAAIAGGAPQLLELSKQGSLSVALPASAAGKVRVDLALKGRGAPHYTAILRGFGSETGELSGRAFSIHERAVLAPAPLWRGKPVAVGFSTVRNRREQWSNRVLNLARGTNAQAYVSLRRDESRGNAAEGDWLILEIPLPAGARVRPDSVTGAVTGLQVLADRIVTYIPPESNWSTVQFELEGAIPGHYRVGPAVLRSASNPELISIGKPGEFDILPLGSTIPDAYRATPDELYALGMAAHADGDSAKARDWLTRLMKDFEGNLADEDSSAPLQQAAGALFFLALEKNDAREVVRWFEVLREKRPDLVIPFDKILAVAKSYSTIDEHERALSILRASVEQTFGVDLKVAGAMESQGDASAALNLLARLWSEYPDAPAVLETWLALSDKLLTKAPGASEDKSLVRDGRTRANLHMEGTRLLQMFLCLYPKDPQAPEAALNLIAAHLGLEDYATASGLAQNFAARFTTPEFADAFLYSRAVAEWYLGNDEEALRVCEKVAAAVYKDAKGIERASKNRDLAQYILAQIHHARREVERAAEYYAKVEQSFADAKAALAELRAHKLALDEVTRAKPGESVRLALRSKNIAEVELAIYPVDLMTLYLREGDLSKVAQVDLSGIAPELSRTMKLDGGNALRESEQKLELALPKTGAYLVIARGGELFASGLILISDLELDVSEDAPRGGVRVQVVDSRDGKYVRDVDVRVVGSSDKKIQRSKTDLRGMASLDNVNGLATIIARAGQDRYAFYRGTSVLGNLPVEGKQLKAPEPAVDQLSQSDYLSNVIQFNASNQSERAGRLKEEIGRQRLGVQINQVK